MDQDDSSSGQRLTRLLERAGTGDPEARNEAFDRVYSALHRAAALRMRDQPDWHTLQPTALVHEVFLKLFAGGDREWESRQHFLGVAAKAMRQILVDHARGKGRKKRGGDAERDPLEGLVLPITELGADLGDLDDALTALEAEDARAATVVELRFFAGLTVPEVAAQIGISARQVERDWTFARVWLQRRLG